MPTVVLIPILANNPVGFCGRSLGSVQVPHKQNRKLKPSVYAGALQVGYQDGSSSRQTAR